MKVHPFIYRTTAHQMATLPSSLDTEYPVMNTTDVASDLKGIREQGKGRHQVNHSTDNDVRTIMISAMNGKLEHEALQQKKQPSLGARANSPGRAP